MLDDRIVEQTEEVLDLGVTINNRLNFSKHIAKIVTKAHRRANLIIRCFMSRDTSSLVKAINVYVRPVLEYCSVVWWPYLMKDIIALESVQRRFTRRIRADLIFAYKLIFGLLDNIYVNLT